MATVEDFVNFLRKPGTITGIVVLLAASVAGKIFYTRYVIGQRLLKYRARKRKEFQDRVTEAKLVHIDSATAGSPSGDEKKILSLTATEIAAAVSKGDLTASAVVSAFGAHALRTHHEFVCITEPLVHQAIPQARALDEKFQRDKKAIGPLQGVPISLKDSVGVKGIDCSLGTTGHAFNPMLDDALVVQVIKKAGGIPFVKSNIPQTLISYECVNPLFGRTLNPYNTNYTSGGSSGGEAALIANRASPLGIGTDIGGSLRLPASFCGICALKPTSRRFSTIGFRASVPGQEAIAPAAGPMANNPDDCALLMRTALCDEVFSRDHEIIPLPFDQKEYTNNGKLRVGYYTHDGFLECCPASVRAVKQTVEALKADGHTVIEFKPPNLTQAVALYYALISGDNGNTITDQLKKDKWESYTKTGMTSIRLPSLIRKLIVKAMEAFGDRRLAMLLKNLRPKNTYEMWKFHAERKRFRQMFFNEWQDEKNRFDVIICPVAPLPSIPHESYKDLAFGACYTLVYNLLDYPAGTVPVTRVKQSDVYTSLAPGGLEKKVRSHYDPVKGEGLPVGVQVVGLPYKDETVLRAMRIISKLCPYTDKPHTKSGDLVSNGAEAGNRI